MLNTFLNNFDARFWLASAFTQERWLGYSLALVLVAYAGLAVLFPDLSEKCSDVMLLLVAIAFFRGESQLRRHPLFTLLWVTTAVALLSWVLMLWQHPEWADGSPKVHKLTYWLLLIPVCYALGGRLRNVFSVWLLALLGLMVAPWINGDGINTLLASVHGERTDLNLLNAQHAAMYFAVVLVAMVAFVARVWRIERAGWLWRCLWCLAVAICLFVIVVTQTRAVWLALLLVCGLMAWLKISIVRLSRKSLMVGLLAASLLASVIVGLAHERISQRLLQERTTLEQFIAGAELDYSSAGIRLHFWRAAVPWIAERPLVGWGVDGKKLVIAHSDSIPEFVRAQDLSHMHNSFLDLLVNFGLFGFVAVALLWAWLIRASLRAYRRGDLPADVLVFFLSYLALWFVINCFESYMQFASGRFVFALVCGGVASLLWRSELSSESAGSTAPPTRRPEQSTGRHKGS